MEFFVKETGIIRKIDELGRIVLPKEIRRSLGIKDGEDLEIFVDNQGIYLQKHSRLLVFHDLVARLCELAHTEMNLNIFVTDRERVVASSIDAILNHELNDKFAKLLDERTTYESMVMESFFEDVELNGYFFVAPILVSSDVIGFVVLVSDQPFLSYMKNFVQFFIKIIGNKIDIL